MSFKFDAFHNVFGRHRGNFPKRAGRRSGGRKGKSVELSVRRRRGNYSEKSRRNERNAEDFAEVLEEEGIRVERGKIKNDDF